VIFQAPTPILTSPLLAQVIALDHNFMSYPWSEKQWRDIDEKSHLLFIGQREHVLAFSLFHLSTAESLAHLLKIVVAPTEQGQISTDFFAMQEEHLRSLGFKRIYLEVSESNLRAQAFYRKLGFKLLHRAKGYYSDGASALMMELPL
jgi:ribosomal-protein-alanine N-acetyltransferase